MGSRFVAMSNTGLSGAELEQQLRALVEETGAKVVFTDLPAGSCNIAAFRLLRDRDVIVVSGVNLPTLLHFVTHPQLVARGRRDGGRRARCADAQGHPRDGTWQLSCTALMTG